MPVTMACNVMVCAQVELVKCAEATAAPEAHDSQETRHHLSLTPASTGQFSSALRLPGESRAHLQSTLADCSA